MKKRSPHAGVRISIGLQTIAVIVIFLLANYFSFAHFVRKDFSRSQKFRLAEQTKRVFREFKEPVEIIVISSPTLLSPITEIFGDIRSLMAEIRFSARDRVRIEYVDPTRDLTRMGDLQRKYNFQNADSLMILSAGGRVKFLPLVDMADFDLRPVAQGEAPRLLAFRGEQALTSALMGLLSPEQQTVYFLQGHGEPSLSAGSPIAVLVEAIQNQNVKVATLTLASADSLPPDAGALVLLAPTSDLEEREALLLEAWLRQRGRMIVLLDPTAKTPRLHQVLRASGVIPHDDRVLRTIQLPFATGILREVTAEISPTTEWARRLAGANIFLPGATQSLGLDTEFGVKNQVSVRPLLLAAEQFWGETDYALNRAGGVRYDEGKDNGQPLAVAAAADRGAAGGDDATPQASRLIVIGSAQFAKDIAISPQGLDFLLGGINSLLDRSQMSGVTPKTLSHFALNLTDEQIQRIALFVMIVIPALAAFAGIFVWWKRRS